MKKIAIIGAGITGLSIGYYLKKANIPFVIFEKSNRVGGVIHSEKHNDFIIERGPNTGVVANVEIAELLEEINQITNVKYADEKAKKRLIWKNGRWEALPSGPISAIKTPLFSLKDKLKVAGEAFRKKGNFEEETLAETVKRRLGESFLDYAIDPFVSGVYAGEPNYLITKYAFAKLYNLEEKYGSFIRGSIKIKKERSQKYNEKVTKKIFSFTNGLEDFPNTLQKIIGKENIKLNSNIKIQYIDNNEFKINNELFTDVISTIKPDNLENIFPFVSKENLKSIKNLKYADIIEVSIGFKHWKGINLDAFGGLVPSKENKDILGILFMSSQFKNRASHSGATFSVFVGGIKKPEMISKTDDELREIVSKNFCEMMGISDFNPDLFLISKHRRAIAQYGINTPKKLEAITNIEKQYKGMILGGSIKDGIGLADRIAQAKKIAKRITND